MDYDEVQRRAKAGTQAALGIPASNTLAQLLNVSNNRWREELRGLMEGAIVNEHVVREGMPGDELYAALGLFTEQRAFIGTLSALRRAGLYSGPLPGEPGWV